MLEVLAIKMVRSMIDSPVVGSINSGNSFNTSVISFPRSPQPTYTTISTSAHFAIWCCTTVLPAPNGPGTAAAPPFVTGKKVSITRCPVNIGTSVFFFTLYGRPRRTGQRWIKLKSRTPDSVSIWYTVSSILKFPASTFTNLPFTP